MARTQQTKASAKAPPSRPAAREKPKATTPSESVATKSPSRVGPKGKLGILVDLLHRDEGARIEEMTKATGWQSHSVRGALAGALKARGYEISSQPGDGGRIYRIASIPTKGASA